ncbi:MAG: TatD family hydrolase [Cyclobacteriaceae bacterium]|nr:TatD family hydrolase [Cyclobacteriaceae bacterium]
MNTWTDTHAHIYVKEFDADRSDALVRARDLGVSKIYMPNIDADSIDAMLEAERKNPDLCIPMIGLHPCSVKKDFEKQLYVMEDWLRKRPFAAVGEMGTDLYWDKSFWGEQQEAFRIQAGWARQQGLPLVIHCRESIDETLALLTPFADPKFTGIFHCFTGTAEQARRVVELGFYIGVGGVSTFKNGGLDRVLPGVPLDRLVLETDSPYLAPVPHRGKRNEPAYLSLIAARVSSLMGVTEAELSEVTTRNARSVFGEGTVGSRTNS